MHILHVIIGVISITQQYITVCFFNGSTDYSHALNKQPHNESFLLNNIKYIGNLVVRDGPLNYRLGFIFPNKFKTFLHEAKIRFFFI